MKHMNSAGESGFPRVTPVSVLKKFEKIMTFKPFRIYTHSQYQLSTGVSLWKSFNDQHALYYLSYR